MACWLAIQDTPPPCRNSWRLLFIHHPHLRFDGLYVSRNSYVKPGVPEFLVIRRTYSPVNVCVYFRYYR